MRCGKKNSTEGVVDTAGVGDVDDDDHYDPAQINLLCGSLNTCDRFAVHVSTLKLKFTKSTGRMYISWEVEKLHSKTAKHVIATGI